MTLTNKTSNSLQNFSTSPEEKFGRKGKKFGHPATFTFEGIWTEEKHICLFERKYFLDFPRIRKDMRSEIFF
jgi:hypothetical protein